MCLYSSEYSSVTQVGSIKSPRAKISPTSSRAKIYFALPRSRFCRKKIVRFAVKSGEKIHHKDPASFSDECGESGEVFLTFFSIFGHLEAVTKRRLYYSLLVAPSSHNEKAKKCTRGDLWSDPPALQTISDQTNFGLKFLLLRLSCNQTHFLIRPTCYCNSLLSDLPILESASDQNILRSRGCSEHVIKSAEVTRLLLSEFDQRSISSEVSVWGFETINIKLLQILILLILLQILALFIRSLFLIDERSSFLARDTLKNCKGSLFRRGKKNHPNLSENGDSLHAQISKMLLSLWKY